MTAPIAPQDRIPVTAADGTRYMARRLGPADAPALQTFDAALAPATRRRFLPHAYDDATLARLLARSDSGEDLILGLFDGNALIGYLFLWYARERVPLLGIGLLDAYHHRGLGRRLMTILIEQARITGRDGIELTTWMDNHNAFALYQKCGFTYYGDVENRTGDGSIVTERAMFLELKPGARPMDKPHAPPV